MKRTSMLILLLVAVLLVVASCATGPVLQKVSKEEKELQKQVDAVNKGRIYIMQGTVYLRPGARSGLI